MAGDQSLIAYTAGQGITPATMGEAMKLSEMLAASAFVPAAYKGKPGDILAAIQMGSEVGLKPMQALQSIAVINGRPSIFGDGFLALIISSPAYERHEERYEGVGSTRQAVVQMWRKGNPTPFVGIFGAKDAGAAGLSGRDTYKQYADRMYMWRARHIAGQAGFSDVTKGILPAEVAEDYPITVESTVVMPQRKSAVSLPPPPPVEVATAAPAEEPAPPPADEPVNGDGVITQAQIGHLMGEAKKGGHTEGQLSIYLKRQYGVTSKKDIKKKDFNAILDWAITPNEPGANG